MAMAYLCVGYHVVSAQVSSLVWWYTPAWAPPPMPTHMGTYHSGPALALSPVPVQIMAPTL